MASKGGWGSNKGLLHEVSENICGRSDNGKATQGMQPIQLICPVRDHPKSPYKVLFLKHTKLMMTVILMTLTVHTIMTENSNASHDYSCSHTSKKLRK